METVEVADISVYRAGTLHSFWGQQFVKGGKLEEVGTGFGIVKGGTLYRFQAVVLLLEEAQFDSCLRIAFHIPTEGRFAKLQIKDEYYPEWMDYEPVSPQNGKAVVRGVNGGSIAAGTYRVVVTDTTDYSEIYSNEVTYKPEIPVRLLCMNNCILMLERGADLMLVNTIKSNDILYTLQFYNDRYGGWSATPNKIVGTGEPLIWNDLKGGRYRMVAQNIETGLAFASNVPMIKPLDQLVLCDTASLKMFVFNGDIIKQLTRNGEGYEDFSLSFAVGGTGSLYNRVVLTRFVLSSREWQEVQVQEIVMETADTKVTGTFAVHVPGRYRAEAVNTVTGEKTESNFVTLNSPD